MTIGFSSLGCPDLSLEETLALAARHGIGAVELRALGGSLDLPAYLEVTYGSPAALAEKLRDVTTSIVSLDTSLRLMDCTAADREACLRFVPWAEALRVPRLRVFDGGRSLDDGDLAKAVGVLNWWEKLRRDHGWRVDLMVETHDALVTSPAVQRLMAAVPETAILWDAHHTWKKGGEDPVFTWQAIGSSVCHIHVKDSVSRSSANASFAYVLPGSGEFPMRSLVRALHGGEYAGPVCLEWEKLWHPDLATLDEALTAAHRCGWWSQTRVDSA
jgi:sugar phosphate isomerase/epimerase